jgi:NAD(P)-dependent dehydrogenase (short-subunit alcohol dehydrogenase family)
MLVVLITGTSRGLGFELARYYLGLDHIVIGVSRSDSAIDDVSYHHCTIDITEESSVGVIKGFVESLPISRIDILINNAGTGSHGFHLSDVDPQEVLNQINLHCIGALRVVKAAQKHLSNSKIVNVTSRLGSIRQNERGDFSKREFSYSYRIAKCAQNMLSLCMSNDPDLSGTTVISVNPGLLNTAAGSDDVCYTAAEGAVAFAELVGTAREGGIYHAFGEEAVY